MIGFSIVSAVLIMTTASPGESIPSAKQRDGVRKACMADVMRLCPKEAAARDRQGVRACLKANFSKTSQACQSGLRSVATGRDAQGDGGSPQSPDRSSPPASKR